MFYLKCGHLNERVPVINRTIYTILLPMRYIFRNISLVTEHVHTDLLNGLELT